MSSNPPIRMVHCHACMVTAPRDVEELERPSGRFCLICGSRLISDPLVTAEWTEQPIFVLAGEGLSQ